LKCFANSDKKIDKKTYNLYKFKETNEEYKLEILLEENKFKKHSLIRFYLNTDSKDAIKVFLQKGYWKKTKNGKKYYFTFVSKDELVKLEVKTGESNWNLDECVKLSYQAQPTLGVKK